MEDRTLEITLQYAKDLKKVNLLSKMEVYAVVSISGGDEKSNQKITTPVDHDGGENPTWNFPMKFAVEEAALQQNRLVVDFKLVAQRALGDRDVGKVHVAVKELLDSPAKCGAGGKKFVSYQVRKPSGRPKGQLNFWYKFTGKSATAAEAEAGVKVCGEAVKMYPVVDLGPVYPLAAPDGYWRPSSYLTAAPDGYWRPSSYLTAAPGEEEEGGGFYPPPATGFTPGVYPPPPVYGYPPPPVYSYPPPPPPQSVYSYLMNVKVDNRWL